MRGASPSGMSRSGTNRTRRPPRWCARCGHRPESTSSNRPATFGKRPARSGLRAPTLEVRGYAAIEARAARAYEDFVARGEYVFRSRDNAAVLRNIVKFNWEMVSTATGEVAGAGLEVLMLDDQGRITTDSQFVER